MSNYALSRSLVLWLALFCFTNPSAGLGFFSRSQTEGRTRNSAKTKSVVCTNKKYGFHFSLPRSWRGYSITIGEWEDGANRSYSRGEVMPPPIKGPLISIGHPLSTESNPRQDIPIMVFTVAQWKLVEEGKLFVSAAPIGPNELGRNAKCVFALPPRFNYACIYGWQEAKDIIQNHPLRPF